MKLILALTGTLALAAPSTPFPAPKLTGATPDTRCDWGPVMEVKPDRTLLVLKTEAGAFEVQLGSAVKVAGADGRPLGSALELKPGQNVRVYYLVDNKLGGGARAQETDAY